MDELKANLSDEKARLSELTERATPGESVVVTRRGHPIAGLVCIESPRKPIDLDDLRSLTRGAPKQTESAGKLMRRLREDAHY